MKRYFDSFNQPKYNNNNRAPNYSGGGGGGGFYSNQNNTNKRPKSNYEDYSDDNFNQPMSSFSNWTPNSNKANNNNQNNIYQQVSRSIWDFYQKNSQTQECLKKKIELREALYHMFKDVFPYLGVFIVGSSANGFGTNESDVDICLVISQAEINQKQEAIYLLKLIAKSMRRAAFFKNLLVISAKVPIIKFHDAHTNIDCDINLNNTIGIRNTHLLGMYAECDWRVKPLVLFVKKWAKYHDINDASQQTISSYSFALMTIFYLQAVCDPPVLPILQDLYPEKFNIEISIDDLKLNEQLPKFTSENTQNLGELFHGFLEYYSKFNFQNYIISVRKGQLIPKSLLPFNERNGNYSQWKYILIEEPFDLSNTARSVFDGYTFNKILDVFSKSKIILEKNKNIKSLFEDKLYDQGYGNNRNNYNRGINEHDMND